MSHFITIEYNDNSSGGAERRTLHLKNTPSRGHVSRASSRFGIIQQSEIKKKKTGSNGWVGGDLDSPPFLFAHPFFFNALHDIDFSAVQPVGCNAGTAEGKQCRGFMTLSPRARSLTRSVGRSVGRCGACLRCPCVRPGIYALFTFVLTLSLALG